MMSLKFVFLKLRIQSVRIASCCILVGAFGCAHKRPVVQLNEWLANPEGTFNEQRFAYKSLSGEEAGQAAHILLKYYQKELLTSKGDEWENRILSFDTLSLPFFYKVWGDEPVNGHSLFISLHGGGSAPAEVNDQQYENQKHLYDSVMNHLEGVYLAARAPTDDWNMWHKSHVDPFLQDIIRLAVLKERVNPDRVYLLGYSAGGDGVFQLAPRLAPYLAAAAMMAGHPGDASALSLRNLPYTIHMGALDSSFNRNGHAAEWGELLDSLQTVDPSGYVHEVQIHEGRAHWMYREDAIALPWMTQFERVRNPRKVVWQQDDVLQTDFYWLSVLPDEAAKSKLITASYDASGKIEIATEDYDYVYVGLNDEMFSLDLPVTVLLNGMVVFEGKLERNISSIAHSLGRTVDGARAYPAILEVDCKAHTASQKKY